MVLSFKDYMLSESFINLIGDDNKKQDYVDAVWGMLQLSYEAIGGIHGSGFKDKQDMIDNIAFWKISTKSGKPIAVAMYKDSGGRKVVAYGTDGSTDGKSKIVEIIKADITRSYAELSGATLGILMKNLDWNYLKDFVVTPNQVKDILGKTITQLNQLSSIPSDAKLILSKYPQLEDYGYVRKIGSDSHFKVMFGKV